VALAAGFDQRRSSGISRLALMGARTSSASLGLLRCGFGLGAGVDGFGAGAAGALSSLIYVCSEAAAVHP
jgi:hypothetical protein